MTVSCFCLYYYVYSWFTWIASYQWLFHLSPVTRLILILLIYYILACSLYSSSIYTSHSSTYILYNLQLNNQHRPRLMDIRSSLQSYRTKSESWFSQGTRQNTFTASFGPVARSCVFLYGAVTTWFSGWQWQWWPQCWSILACQKTKYLIYFFAKSFSGWSRGRQWYLRIGFRQLIIVFFSPWF